MSYNIERRQLKRKAFCRGCDKEMMVEEEVITTYSFRNRGQHIYFCIDCAEKIGKLAYEEKM